MDVPKKIIKRLKKRDKKALEWLFEKYSKVFKAIALRYTKNEILSDDIVQEVFLIIYDKIDQYSGKGSFEGWMKRITVNLALKYLKEQKKDIFELPEDDHFVSQQELEEDIDFSDPKSVILNTNFTQDEIFEAISELPDGFRIVFNMYVLEGFKHKEIAEKLGISVNTSKTQLLRARKHLQKKLYKIALEKQKQLIDRKYKNFFKHK